MDYVFLIKWVIIGGLSGAGGLGVAAWLCKKVIIHFLDKDFDKYKQELSHLYSTKLEEVKNNHVIKELEHETRFRSLHQKRFELIDELYEKLVECQLEIANYVKEFVPAGEATETERGSLAAEKWNILNRFYLTRRLFFTPEECALLDTYIAAMKKAHIKFAFRKTMGGSQTEAWIKIVDDLEKNEAEIKVRLENEFRVKLGIIG